MNFQTGVGATAFAPATIAAANTLLAARNAGCPVDAGTVTAFEVAYIKDAARGFFPTVATGIYSDDVRLYLSDALGLPTTSMASGTAVISADASIPSACAAVPTAGVTTSSMTPWIVGGTAIAGALLIYYFFRTSGETTGHPQVAPVHPTHALPRHRRSR